jgi:hypothetical protein
MAPNDIGENLEATVQAQTTHRAPFHGQLLREPGQLRNNAAPAGAQLSYFGGRVVSNMQVVEVLYGSGSYLPQVTSTASPSIATFYQGVLNSAYVDWLTEYNTTGKLSPTTNQTIGRGGFVSQVQISPSTTNDGPTIDDTNIKAEISAQIQAGHLPAPTTDAQGNNNTYYAIFFPHGKTITSPGGQSCVGGGFCAYHGTISNAGGKGEVYYGVHPDFQAGSGCEVGCGAAPTAFGNYTQVASHEMVETITDAEVGLAQTFGPPLGWYDQPLNQEIGDLCNDQHATIVGGDGVTYDVQTEFSNAANDCIASRTVTNDFSVSANPTSLSIAAGSSGTSAISTATVSGNAQTISLRASGLPTGVTATFNPASVSSGASSTLTVTAAASAAASTFTLTVTGSAASGSHTTTISVTVRANNGNNFSIALNPTSLSIARRGSATTTVSTKITSGSAQSIRLTASGLPSGVTATFTPATITAGQSSTLRVTAAANATVTTRTVTITGTGSAATHTAALSLTIHR